jgi:GMP synthase (glutamine-hydrolysing)
MSLSNRLRKILIIDFGSQFTQLIARRIREFGVFSEIISHKKIKISEITKKNIGGIILSGGPLNVYENHKFKFDKEILRLGIPVLGICFGHQVLSKELGGKVKKSKHREFGLATIIKVSNSILTKNFFNSKNTSNVWMSHADQVSKMPKNFKIIASTKNSRLTIIENSKDNFYGVQFHPEVTHTPKGKILLRNFLFLICKIKKTGPLKIKN